MDKQNHENTSPWGSKTSNVEEWKRLKKLTMLAQETNEALVNIGNDLKAGVALALKVIEHFRSEISIQPRAGNSKSQSSGE